jgi:hypothetical protein
MLSRELKITELSTCFQTQYTYYKKATSERSSKPAELHLPSWSIAKRTISPTWGELPLNIPVTLKPQAAHNKQNNRIKTLLALLGQSSAHPKPPEKQSFLLHRCQQLPTETLKKQKSDLTTESTAEQ